MEQRMGRPDRSPCTIEEREMLEQESIITWIVIGGFSGWLAGLIVEGYGLGLLGNIAIGILGAAIAGLSLAALGVHVGTTTGNVVASTLGAVLLLLLAELLRRVTR
jgi:uncharacterized membrane protein YeaQ/YmgE (transglycosylase-associated protein family)